MDNFPYRDFLFGGPGPVPALSPGVDAPATIIIPTYENVMRLVADEDTFLLARVGLREAWPDLELPSSNHDTELPSDHHDCSQVMVPNGGPAPKSPVRAGTNGCGDKPGTPDPRPLKCRDAGCTRQGLPVTMHRLRCGHYLCRGCLTRRATSNVAISPPLQRLLTTTSQALYDPGSEQYARTRQEKEALLTRIWVMLNWTCCGRIVPFGDFLHRACLSARDAEALVQMSVEVLRTMEGEGNRRLLRVLDDVMRLEVRAGVEVAVCTLPGLDLTLRNPFRRTPANPAGSGEGIPRLVAQRTLLDAAIANTTLAPSVLLPGVMTAMIPMVMADEPPIVMASGIPPDTAMHVERPYDGHPCDMADGHPFAVDNEFRSKAAGGSSDGAEGPSSRAGGGSEGALEVSEEAGGSTNAFSTACRRNGIRMIR